MTRFRRPRLKDAGRSGILAAIAVDRQARANRQAIETFGLAAYSRRSDRMRFQINADFLANNVEDTAKLSMLGSPSIESARCRLLLASVGGRRQSLQHGASSGTRHLTGARQSARSRCADPVLRFALSANGRIFAGCCPFVTNSAGSKPYSSFHFTGRYARGVASPMRYNGEARTTVLPLTEHIIGRRAAVEAGGSSWRIWSHSSL